MLQLGFHWAHGWHFSRQEDGSVKVFHVDKYEPFYNDVIFTIPAAEWASIVCSVSKDGETLDRWNAAQDFHGRESRTLNTNERDAMDKAFWKSVDIIGEGYLDENK